VTIPRLLSFELVWAHAAFDAIFPEPPRSVFPHGAASMQPGRFVDDLIAKVPLEQSIGIRLALWIVALAPLFTIRRLATIATLAPSERARVFDRLLASPVYAIRQLTLSLKALAALLYAQSPPVRAQMMAPMRGEIVQLRKKPEPAGGSHEHAAE
jgi:hypothetical protein